VPTVHNTSDGYGSRWIIEEQQSDFHKGLDITKPGCAGEAIVASAGGTIIQAGNNNNGYGNCVIIDHGNNISTLYAHMSKTAVSVGAVVNQGETIGYIGNTGNSYGYHLHFEVRVRGQHTDPKKYVSY
jgi:murein DD-endopeptidase MepM/ murein hydrolase activator NlpD